MRQISATMFIPFDDANLAKKNRIIAIFHNKTHAPPSSVLSLTTVESRPPTHKKNIFSLFFNVFFLRNGGKNCKKCFIFVGLKLCTFGSPEALCYFSASNWQFNQLIIKRLQKNIIKLRYV